MKYFLLLVQWRNFRFYMKSNSMILKLKNCNIDYFLGSDFEILGKFGNFFRAKKSPSNRTLTMGQNLSLAELLRDEFCVFLKVIHLTSTSNILYKVYTDSPTHQLCHIQLCQKEFSRNLWTKRFTLLTPSGASLAGFHKSVFTPPRNAKIPFSSVLTSWNSF